MLTTPAEHHKKLVSTNRFNAVADLSELIPITHAFDKLLARVCSEMEILNGNEPEDGMIAPWWAKLSLKLRQRSLLDLFHFSLVDSHKHPTIASRKPDIVGYWKVRA
jgi:hypothetical protein